MTSISRKDQREAEDRMKEMLICKIEQRPGFYDKSNPLYRDSKWKNSSFTKIAGEIGCTVLEAQTWWRSLRDSFTAELRIRESENISGKKSDKRKPFRFNEAMAFLSPYVRKRASLSTVDEVLECTTEADSLDWKDVHGIFSSEGIAGIGAVAEVVDQNVGEAQTMTPNHQAETVFLRVGTPALPAVTSQVPAESFKNKPLKSLPVLSTAQSQSGTFKRVKTEPDLTVHLTQAISSLDKVLTASKQDVKTPEALLGESIGMVLQSIQNKDIKMKWKRAFRNMLSDMEDEIVMLE